MCPSSCSWGSRTSDDLRAFALHLGGALRRDLELGALIRHGAQGSAWPMTDVLLETATIPVTDPSTGEPIGAIPAGSAQAVDEAVGRARAAAAGWAATSTAERAGALKAAAARVRAALDELTDLQAREGGKHAADSRGGVEAGIGAIEQYAELAPLHRGRSLQARAARWTSCASPRGVAAVLVPWNDPVAIACQGIAGASAAGNASSSSRASGRRCWASGSSS